MTDSGGIQEETNILHIPCITLRDNTERPETVEAGSNTVAGIQPERIMELTNEITENKDLYEKMKSAPVVFGKGDTGKRIVDIIEEKFS